jgi:hypothetical protein
MLSLEPHYWRNRFVLQGLILCAKDSKSFWNSNLFFSPHPAKGAISGKRGQVLWFVVDGVLTAVSEDLMSRRLRLEAEGGIYHVMNRGNYRTALSYLRGTRPRRLF